MKVNEAAELNEKLQAHVTDLEESKRKLVDELDELKKNLAEKENEIISVVKDMEAQLQRKNQQYDELYGKVEGLQQKVGTSETLVAEREAEMKQLRNHMTGKYRELETQFAEVTHTLKIKDESIKV